MVLTSIANDFLQKYYAEEFSAHADKTLHEAIGASKGQLDKVIAQSLRTIEDAQAEGRNVSVVAEYELNWQDTADRETGLSVGQVLMSARLVNARVMLEGETARPDSSKAKGSLEFASAVVKDTLNSHVGRSLTHETVNVPLTGTDEKIRRFKQIEQLLKNAKPGSDEFNALTKERDDLLPYYEALANARKQRNADEAAVRAKADAESKKEEERRRQAKAEQILVEQQAQEKFQASQTPGLPGLGPVGQGSQLTGPFFGPTQMGKMEQAAYAAQLFRNRRAALIAEAKKNPIGEKLTQLRAERDSWLYDIKWFFANVVDKQLKSGQWSDGWPGVHDLKDMLKWAQGMIPDDNNVLVL